MCTVHLYTAGLPEGEGGAPGQHHGEQEEEVQGPGPGAVTEVCPPPERAPKEEYQPIKTQHSVHVICLDQSETSIQVK